MAPKRTELCLCVLFARNYVSELGALRCWCVTELCLSSFFARSCVFRPAAPKYTELCLVPEHGVVSSRRQKHGVVSCSGARSCVSRLYRPVEGFWRWYTRIAIPVSGLQTLAVQCVVVTADCRLEQELQCASLQCVCWFLLNGLLEHG